MDKEKTKWRNKWREHKNNTKGRTDKNGDPIEFRLSFEQWLQIWLESGHINERGRGKGQYVMSRINDLGHYEVSNIEIKTGTENHKEGNSGKKLTDETRAKMSAAKKGKAKLTCPHCGKSCAPIMFARWHGDNCKLSSKEIGS